MAERLKIGYQRNVLYYLDAATSLSSVTLSNVLSKYIYERFGEVGKSDSLLQLPHVRAEVVLPEEEETCLLQEAL